MPVAEAAKTITVEEFLVQMEKNGYEQSFGHLWEGADGEEAYLPHQVVKACALGQGLLNLGVDRITLNGALRRLFEDIMRWNDIEHLSISEITGLARKRYPEQLDRYIGLGGVGGPTLSRPNG